MLLNVHVKNLALIEDVDICLEEGLNILTGETGAGKSIIIGSINIALGGKARKDIIRKNADYGLVELVFSVDNEEIKNKLISMDVSIDEDNQIIISKKLTNNKSITKVNGETVTNAFLKEISSLLIDVHGQHDHESLLHKNKHLDLLDNFIGEEGIAKKNEVREIFNEYKKLIDKLSEYDISEETRKREMDFLEYEISELTDANLIEGEDDKLEEEYKLASNASKIMEALQYSYEVICGGENSAESLITMAAKELSKINIYDEKIMSMYTAVMDMEAICRDLSYDMSSYIDNMSYDEERMQYIYSRLDVINKLKLKHGNSIEKILNKCKEFEDKLEKYRNYENELRKINKEIDIIVSKLDKACCELTDIRKDASLLLSARIVEVLETLNFKDVQFAVDFESTSNYTAKGKDSVAFMICTNKGEDMKPLSDIASGGELSRIMLGIKTILASVDNVETLIFDEIDTGISGRTAQMVAEKMKLIAKNHQVICITHLPQIAAMADSHYLIEKHTSDLSTKTEINKLSYEESIEELARMLGGSAITEAVLLNAKEMKNMALEVK
jgi:DNA repair protein RecN (Recombination protein N)